MARFLLRRLVHAAVALWLVCTVTFAIVHAAPGGPALLADPKLSVEERTAIARRLGVDRPLVEQYGRWLQRAVRGDLGRSFLYGTDVLATIGQRLPRSLLLAGCALLLSLALALPLAARCAEHPGGRLDRLAGFASGVALAVPAFWLGLVAILLVAVRWRLLPAGGAETIGAPPGALDRLRHLILPSVVLASASAAELFRHARAQAAAMRGRPHVRTARAKGATPRAVRWRHVMRTALGPVATLVGLQLPRLVGGAAITESVFAWPGMGRLGIEAALARDYPLVMAVTLVVAMGVLVASAITDLAYVALDPRLEPDR